jgi:hypothetical protein
VAATDLTSHAPCIREMKFLLTEFQRLADTCVSKYCKIICWKFNCAYQFSNVTGFGGLCSTSECCPSLDCISNATDVLICSCNGTGVFWNEAAQICQYVWFSLWLAKVTILVFRRAIYDGGIPGYAVILLSLAGIAVVLLCTGILHLFAKLTLRKLAHQ